jgi:NADPH-dependent curcumin reductase CurA
MVGQLTRMLGGTAYGVAGSDEKCAHAVAELGFADCFNYKQPGYPASLVSALPYGVDVYHDNVGGSMLVDALGVLKNYGTVILCGLISQYNTADKGRGFNLGPAILKRAVLKGLIVYDFEDQYAEFLELAAPWVRDGSIRYREDRVSGIEKTGAHFAKLMSGNNFGKTLVVLEEGHN